MDDDPLQTLYDEAQRKANAKGRCHYVLDTRGEYRVMSADAFMPLIHPTKKWGRRNYGPTISRAIWPKGWRYSP